MWFDIKLTFWNNYNCVNQFQTFVCPDFVYMSELKSFEFEKINVCLN